MSFIHHIKEFCKSVFNFRIFRIFPFFIKGPRDRKWALKQLNLQLHSLLKLSGLSLLKIENLLL
jgi:hypothetical protein